LLHRHPVTGGDLFDLQTGVNTNVEGEQTRIIARYSGSAPAYRARCDAVAAEGYRELALA
jgi:hypothetical protein